MKKIVMNFIVFILCTCKLFAFNYYSDIIITGENKNKFFYITEDIYSKSKRNLKDVALFDEKEKEIPFVIDKYQENYIKEVTQRYDGRFLKDKKYESGTKREITIKINENHSGLSILGNLLNIRVTTAAPMRNPFKAEEIKLFGSNDNKNWEEIKINKHLVDGGVGDHNLKFYFEESVYSYFRLEIPAIAKMSMKSVSFFLEEDSIQNYIENYSHLYVRDITSGIYDINGDETLLQVRTNNLPLDFIRLYSGNLVNSRYYVYSGKENIYKLETPIYSGKIVKLNNIEDLIIKLDRNEKHKIIYIKIVNQNVNLKRLNITAAHGKYSPDKIVFQKNSRGSNYQVFYGNAKWETQNNNQENQNKLQDYNFQNCDMVSLNKPKESINLIVKTNDFIPLKNTGKWYNDVVIIIIISSIIVFSGILIRLLRRHRSKDENEYGNDEDEDDCYIADKKIAKEKNIVKNKKIAITDKRLNQDLHGNSVDIQYKSKNINLEKIKNCQY
ncbi:MAG: hypothetical protein LBT51_01055 [Fusobacteriaceae bacterium]|jgi:hypothetical protein|nr:hypothetical protein [Fusobacteriaceae bacterium]